MAIVCTALELQDPYERIVTAWVDGRDDGALQFTARLSDPAVDLEVSLTAYPAPSYEVLRGEARARSEPTRTRCGALLDRFVGVRGLRMVSGFRRRVAALLGDAPGAQDVAAAAVEAARLSRQVTRAEVGSPSEWTPYDFYRMDLSAWPEFVDMCFTYRAESAALFRERTVSTPAVLDMYAPRPGQRMVFHRYKRTQVAAQGQTLHLYQSMFDQVHGFELWYDLDAVTHEIRRARLLTPRLPYMGLCEQPQERVRDLVGLRLDERWPSVVRAAVGGPRGCFQLTDLTSDLFRFLTLDAS